MRFNLRLLRHQHVLDKARKCSESVDTGAVISYFRLKLSPFEPDGILDLFLASNQQFQTNAKFRRRGIS